MITPKIELSSPCARRRRVSESLLKRWVKQAEKWMKKQKKECVENLIKKGEVKNADLSNMDLSGVNFYDSRFYNISFHNSRFYNSSFDNSRFYKSRFYNSRFYNSSFHSSSFHSSSFYNSSFDNSRFYDSRFHNSNFDKTAIPPLLVAQTRILPDGDLIGWKKCKDNVIVKLQIPADAKRSHAFGRKCRCEYAVVLDVIGAEEGESYQAKQNNQTPLIYRKGKTVRCHKWDENWTEECSGGIHFFITRIEAEIYT